VLVLILCERNNIFFHQLAVDFSKNQQLIDKERFKIFQSYYA